MLSNEEKKQILQSYLEIVEDISNKDYQIKSWIKGEIGTDFGETCCLLSDFGDPIFENHHDYFITEKQFTLLKKFRDEFRVFSDENPSWPPLWIDSPEWAQIMERAKEVLVIFNYKKESSV